MPMNATEPPKLFIAPTLFRLEGVAIEGQDGPVSAYLYQRSVEGTPLCSGGRWIHKHAPP